MKRLQTDFSTLSDRKIKEYLVSGRIVIDPLDKKNINTSSVDVTLGQFYFREQVPLKGQHIYDPWSEVDVRRVWGLPQKAEKYNEGEAIFISPGETILAHTQEFIGGRDGVTTMMKARSSLGRNFIEVCKCAGWGDVGYINRWTMEITNNSRHYTIPLVVGRRVAQIVFFEVGQTSGADYSAVGKYQTESVIEEIKKNWKPEDMLPKMWKDRELTARSA